MGYKILKGYEQVVDTCGNETYFKSNVSQELLNTSPTFDNMSITFVGDEYDNHYLSNVGWEVISENNLGYRIFFSKENMDRLSNIISTKLAKAGFRMIVTPRVIGGVMSDILRKNTPEIGDIYTRYTIPSQVQRNDVANLNERVVNTIVSTIINEEEAKKWNESLSVWDTVYGDFNRKGLRAHSIIRKRESDYMKGQFNLNY
jgi:hypothetical protein